MRNWKFDTALICFGLSLYVIGKFSQINLENPSGLNIAVIIVWVLNGIAALIFTILRYDHYRNIAIACNEADIHEG